jgi:hypothetical protein
MERFSVFECVAHNSSGPRAREAYPRIARAHPFGVDPLDDSLCEGANRKHIIASGVHTVKRFKSVFMAAVLLAFGWCANIVWAETPRWPEQKANAWYAQQPWLIGSNYVPKSAINQLEMWQEATFDPEEIEKELTWAEAMGMNTMRVFLHDLLWQQDAAGFQKRIDRFLTTHAGTRYLISVHSIPRFQGFTTQAGCRVLARRPWRMQTNIRG